MPSPVIRPLLVHPVPAAGTVDISVTDGALGGPLVVRDMTGRIVLESTVEALRFSLDIQDWAAGRYMVWTAVGHADLMVR